MTKRVYAKTSLQAQCSVQLATLFHPFCGFYALDKPVANLLIMGVVFLRFWAFFQRLKVGVTSGCLGET